MVASDLLDQHGSPLRLVVDGAVEVVAAVVAVLDTGYKLAEFVE